MRCGLVLLLLLASPTLAQAQGTVIHGADSVFAGEGIVLAWAVLRAPTEAETQVVIRIVPIGDAYRYVSVDAVDPFSGERRRVLPARPLGAELEVRSPRATFADLPRREIRLYRTADEWRAGTAALTVYYLGVPDTTPEFTSEAALAAYLASALAKLRGR
jgi:hypothetical protein